MKPKHPPPKPEFSPDKSQPAEGADSPGNRRPGAEFFVIGIGASAGALEPVSEILKRLPVGMNLAVILVQHLDPTHESILVELLRRVTKVPVEWAVHGRAVEPGNVYVAPPGSSLAIQRGVLILRTAAAHKSVGDVDLFFESLAEDCRDRAVGVILSGNGADGTNGVRVIKSLGGIVIAQDPSTAAFPSMPRSAISGAAVDRVLPEAAIAEELLKLTRDVPQLWERIGARDESPPAGKDAEQFAAILRLLALRHGLDFSDYKQTTIKRRLVRQMILSKSPDLAHYLNLLQKDRGELDRLCESLLINVTEFFRDPDHFEFLRESVLPEILSNHPDARPIRIWVPGCSTGQETYSLGILMREVLDAAGRDVPVQIFGTDVIDHVITDARAGAYTGRDVANVGPERLSRFFCKTERGYLIEKPIRDMCVFARQNVAKDSPFSHLDLISCRNLMIYLSPKLQRKLMPIFHYALNPTGFLVLGSSESVSGHVDLYRLIDRRYRIYSRKPAGRRTSFEFAMTSSSPEIPILPKSLSSMPEESKEPLDVIREADRIVLHRHGPIGVLVNDELEILQFRGDVSPFLAPTPGRASLNLLRMAREGLASHLQAIMDEARKKNVRVKRHQVPTLQDQVAHAVEIDVTPIEAGPGKERFFLVLFALVDPRTQERKSAGKGAKPKGATSKTSGLLAQVDQLRQDLDATRSFLQATIHKHEATNQELRAANEEIQSSNEELQSTNEELETAKEELQSTNEELTTVNEELHSRQLDLIHVNNDLYNLINSVHLPIVILGQDLRIRRFTPMAEKILNVIPTDTGRRLSDININLSVQDLPRRMNEVIDTLTVQEIEVQDGGGPVVFSPAQTLQNRGQQNRRCGDDAGGHRHHEAHAGRGGGGAKSGAGGDRDHARTARDVDGGAED